jgi:phosphate starvation-inducible PhoH-like protein
MNSFEAGMKVLEKLYTAKGELTEHIIHEALHIDYKANQVEVSTSDDVLLIGTRGQKIKARTMNQRKMLDESKKNDILFAIGPAGTGKTYTAVALAVVALKEREIKRIILTRPAV